MDDEKRFRPRTPPIPTPFIAFSLLETFLARSWEALEHLGTSLEVHEGLVRLTSEEILLVLPLLDLIPALGTVEVAIPSVGRNAVMDVAMNWSLSKAGHNFNHLMLPAALCLWGPMPFFIDSILGTSYTSLISHDQPFDNSLQEVLPNCQHVDTSDTSRTRPKPCSSLSFRRKTETAHDWTIWMKREDREACRWIWWMVDAWNMPMRSNESSVLLVRTDYICIDMHARMQADTHLHLYKDTDMLLRKECFSENTLENIDMGNMWQHSSVIFYIEPIPSGPFRSHPSDSQLAVAVVADVTAAYFASRWLRTKSWISCWPIEWRRPKTRNHLSGWERRSRIDEDSLDSPIYDSMMSILSRYIVFLLFFLGIHYIMTNALDHLHVTSMMLR